MATITYKVTVATGTTQYGTGNRFYINGELMLSYIYKKAILIYLINQIQLTLHIKLAFSTNPNGTFAGCTAYTSGVTSTGTPGTSGAKLL